MKTAMLLIYILLILCVIFLERKSPTEAMLWVIVVACIPYVGAVLYLIFGGTLSIKLTAYVRKKRLSKCCPALPEAKEAVIDPDSLSDEDRQVIRFNHVYNQCELTSYQDIQVYTNGESHYRQLFDDLKKARTCIYIEFYTIHHDTMGKALVKTLTEKAKQGVTVLVMCDFIANVSTPPSMFRPLREAGGRVVRVKPFLTHYRSHRKIVVIDHAISYIGGMNIGEKYADLSGSKRPWRDTQVRMVGASAQVLDRYFLTDWLCSVRHREWEKLVQSGHSLQTRPQTPTENLCQFVVGGVDTNKEAVKMCYLSMIRSAKQRIRIQSPYFIPDESVLDALKTAAAAGVQIELMIPGIKASFFLDPVTTRYCGQLLEYGARVYKYHGYIHAKTMVIDEELCCIGSVNMDMRSLMVDDEVCGIFYEDDFVSRYNRIYDRDIQNCDCYTMADFERRTWKDRFWESFFQMFAPLM